MARVAERSINVLFTSAGRRVELLCAFRRAYSTLDLGGHIVAVDIDPLAPALQQADRPYIVPRLDTDEYIPTLAEICRRENVGVVFPLIDPDIGVLARNREVLESAGARLAVVPVEAAAISADKWLSAGLFRRLGLPTPASWLPAEFDPTQASYPLFIKPRKGSASRDAFRVNTEREARFFAEYVLDPIIQEYLPGPEITNDVVCDLGGKILGVVSRRRIEVRGGEVVKGVTIHDPQVLDGCVRIAEALSAIGPITIQCMMRDGVPCFTEVNARLGGGVPLAIAAGLDIPRLLLASAAGLPVEPPPLGTYRTGLYMSRFDDSLLMTERECAQLARRRLRSGRHIVPGEGLRP